MPTLTAGVHASEEVSFDSEPVQITTDGLDPGRIGLAIGPVFVLVSSGSDLIAELRRAVE